MICFKIDLANSTATIKSGTTQRLLLTEVEAEKLERPEDWMVQYLRLSGIMHVKTSLRQQLVRTPLLLLLSVSHLVESVTIGQVSVVMAVGGDHDQRGLTQSIGEIY